MYETTILDAPPDSAWATIRDFTRIAEWHEAVTRVEHIDNGPGDRVGCVRRMEVDGGAIITERLVALSDRDRCYSYELVDSPVPVRNFVGTVQVVPITRTGQSMLSWTATFDAIEGDGSSIADVVRQTVIVPGFEGLASVCAAARSTAGPEG